MPEILPLDEAVKAISAKTPIGATLRSADWERVPLALKQRAQFSSGVTSARVLQAIQDRLTGQVKLQREQLANGNQATFDRSSFIDAIRQLARDEGLTPEKGQGTVRDITSIPRLGLIYDMQNAQATGFARHKLDTSEGALVLFPAYRLGPSTANEPRPQAWWERRWFQAGQSVGWEGAAKTEMVALKTSPIWSALSRFGTPWPPFDWGSTRELEEVDRAEAIALGLIEENWTPPSDARGGEGFNQQLQASVRGLDPELKQFLKSEFKKDIKIEGDTAWWTGDRKGKELAVGKKARPVPEPAPTPAESQPAAAILPRQLSDLKPVRNLGGSTGAMLMRDPNTGQQFVAKRGNSAAHVQEEFTADSLYAAAGAKVPGAELLHDSAGNPVKLAQFVEGKTLADYLRTASAKDKAQVMDKLGEHFPVDALLGNWDVAGLNHDNIVVDAAGTPWRIDNGGSLRYRAQGTAKTAEEWSAHPMELWSMRDAKTNARTAELFGSADIYKIADRIQATDFEQIIAAAPPELQPMLRARATQLQDTARKAIEYRDSKFIAPHADRITEEVMHLRQAEVAAPMSGQLQQTSNPVELEDTTGRKFNHLRTVARGSSTATTDPGAFFYDKILPAVKTINGHHAKGDTDYNQSKLQEALAQKSALQKLVDNGTAGEQRMAQDYLAMIQAVEKAQGKKDVTLPKFAKTSAGMASVKTPDRSVIEALAEHIKARGGDWDLISNWASEQGGSSGSDASRRLKRWLFDRLNVPAKEFHALPGPDTLKSLTGAQREKYDRSFEVFHAFVQELLGKMDFPGNDRDARLLRVIRTETKASVIPFPPGQSGTYPRGVNESGSLFTPVFSGGRVVTAVPHPRITSIYFLEQTPGTGNTFLYGDSENEVTFMAHGLTARNITGQTPHPTPATDHTKWETK